MGLLINLLLLVLGSAATLTAFGGETWRKGDEPLKQRITRRGWIAISCMVLSLVLGVTKELRASASAAAASAAQESLQAKLDSATGALSVTRRDLARATTDLQATRTKLAAVEPDILNAMIVAIAGIRRESDFATPSVAGQPIVPVLSGRTGRPLVLYGGDLVDYHVFCSDGPRRRPGLRAVGSSNRSGLVLRVDRTDYPLRDEGRQMIIGPVGVPLRTMLVNEEGLDGCQLKLLIESADRSREAAQLQPLIEMIRDARPGTTDR